MRLWRELCGTTVFCVGGWCLGTLPLCACVHVMGIIGCIDDTTVKRLFRVYGLAQVDQVVRQDT